MIQLKKAMATAASSLLQWFGPHRFKSLSMRTVIPAVAHAPENVIVEVTCSEYRFWVKTEGSSWKNLQLLKWVIKRTC
jgi:hypothetical protein